MDSLIANISSHLLCHLCILSLFVYAYTHMCTHVLMSMCMNFFLNHLKVRCTYLSLLFLFGVYSLRIDTYHRKVIKLNTFSIHIVFLANLPYMFRFVCWPNSFLCSLSFLSSTGSILCNLFQFSELSLLI